MIRKIQDTFNDGVSHADTYFNLNERKRFYKLFRNQTGVLPTQFATNAENSVLTTKEFNLKGIQFGNWLSTEDKYDYLSAFWIGMNDLQSIIQFKSKNLGLNNRLAVCFGSRGIANSKAHFSGKNNVINLNRYNNITSIEKMTRFLGSGGSGSLAHEFGHYLDSIFGSELERNKELWWLTDSCTGIKKFHKNDVNKAKFPMRYQMAVIFEKLLWTEQKGVTINSDYAQRLLKIPTISGGGYYRKPIEIWARLFEVYISYKMHKKGLSNTFLTKSQSYIKQGHMIYVNEKEIKSLEKDIDALISMFRRNS